MRTEPKIHSNAKLSKISTVKLNYFLKFKTAFQSVICANLSLTDLFSLKPFSRQSDLASVKCECANVFFSWFQKFINILSEIQNKSINALSNDIKIRNS